MIKSPRPAWATQHHSPISENRIRQTKENKTNENILLSSTEEGLEKGKIPYTADCSVQDSSHHDRQSSSFPKLT